MGKRNQRRFLRESASELATRAVKMGDMSAGSGGRSIWSAEDLRVAMTVYCPDEESMIEMETRTR